MSHEHKFPAIPAFPLNRPPCEKKNATAHKKSLMRHTPNKSMFSMPLSVVAASILQKFLSPGVVPLLLIAAVAMPAFAGSNSRWYVLAYGGKGEMHGEPICHALAYFSESPLPLDLDGDYSGEKPGDLKTQAKVTLLGTMNGRRVFEVKQTVYRRAGARPDAPDANLPPSMKILLVERRAGEFCDIYQNQYAYDPTNEIDQAAILDIGGRKVLKTYETDMHTWFLAYWAMDGLGPLSLNPDALYTAISSASPAGTLPFRGALNLVGSHFTVDIYNADLDQTTLGRVDLDLSVQGNRIVAVRKRWAPYRIR